MGSRRRLNLRRKRDFATVKTPRITYRTRTSHIDSFVIRAFGLRRFRGQEFRILDVGVAPKKSGAPTTEETARVFSRAGINAKIEAIDPVFPKKFEPLKKTVNYRKIDVDSLAWGEKGSEYHYIKAANLSGAPFWPASLKKLADERLAEGGLMLSNVEVVEDAQGVLYDRAKHPVGKAPVVGKGEGRLRYVLFQKQKGEMVPVARMLEPFDINEVMQTYRGTVGLARQRLRKTI
ncbi:MAG: hypothetical protein NT067_03250 [Candidatus Diapherotrites archaeon]|nr:hypothetical protein [Candidatus Diapherotrites archaeon]